MKVSQELADRVQALIRVQTKKKRKCLKCEKWYASPSAGHRICGECSDSVIFRSVKAESSKNIMEAV